MGSIIHFSDFFGNLTLESVEARYVYAYIATCECLEGDPRYTSIFQWKSKFEEAVREGKTLDIKIADIVSSFPLLALAIAVDGVGTKYSFLDYFGSLSAFSHNLKLLNMVDNTAPRVKSHPGLIHSLLAHADQCSVEIALVNQGTVKVWSIFGERQCKLDMKFVDSGRYVSTHGQNSAGERIAIREISDSHRIEELKKLPLVWQPLLRTLKF